jgi:hypothetical protein
MNFYDKNMELIRQNYDYLYKNLIKENNTYTNRLDHIESVDAKDGEKSLSITYRSNTYRLNSMYRPMEEARRWSEQFVFQNINTVIAMFGIGNGMFARAIIERMEESHLLILYEPCYDIFNHVINNYDLSDILSNKRVIVAVEGISDFEFHVAVQGVINISNYKSQIQCVYPNYDKIFAESCIAFFNEIKNSLTTNRININTTIKLSERYIRNIFKNLIYLPNSCTLIDLKKHIPTDLPAIVVAAGPSVEESIEDLKKAKGKAVIFACDRVLDYLLDSGVEPDFVVTIDPIKDRKYFSRRDDVSVPLICTMEANNDILSHHKGMKIYCTSHAFINGIYDLIDKKAYNIITSGSVAIVAYTACVELGFKRVILVGQDLAYSGNVSHAGGAIDNKGEKAHVMIEGIDGNKVKSRYDWKEFVIRYQDLITVNPDVEVIDAKQKGAKIKGTKVMPLKEALSLYTCESNQHKELNFDIKPIFSSQDIPDIITYLEGYLPTMKRISEEAEDAIRKCNTVIREHEKGLSDKKLNDGLRKLSQINKFIEEQKIYALMDHYITARTAPQLSDMLIVSEDTNEYKLTTFRKSKIIYEAVIDASNLIEGFIKDAIENLRNYQQL